MSKVLVKYSVDSIVYTKIMSDLSGSTEYFNLKGEVKENRYICYIIPKNDYKIKLLEVCLTKDIVVSNSTQIFCNGYQSWSYSGIFNKYEKQDKLNPVTTFLTKKIGLKNYSDYYFYDKKIKKGIFRSYSYTYLKTNDKYLLYGSLDEEFAFTIFRTLLHSKKIEIYKDIKGRVISKSFKLFDYITISGDYNVTDKYFSLLETRRTVEIKKLYGFTSWYNFYKDISEDKLLPCLNSLEDSNLFQIDDGYQTFVGDWKNINNEKFPNGLKSFADKIHEKGLLAGLWIAPFVCEASSQLYKNHKDYLLKDSAGFPYYLGNNWSGFYALDIRKKEVQEYIKSCFEFIKEEGFDLIKVDFLYAACMMPNEDFTRSELMSLGTSLIRQFASDKLVLGCGVPLCSAYNKFEYCRVGCDVSLDFYGGRQMKIFNKFPGPSTKNSIINTILRSPMNNHVFMNDPDVFILRKENNKLTIKQKEALAKINTIFGGVNLHSDDSTLLKEDMKKLKKDLSNYSSFKVVDIKKYVSTFKIKLIKDSKEVEIDYNYLGGYILD